MAHTVDATKKRELLPELNKLIISLSNLSGDVAKLELYDNFEASRRVKRALVDMRNKDLKEFQKKIEETRVFHKREDKFND